MNATMIGPWRFNSLSFALSVSGLLASPGPFKPRFGHHLNIALKVVAISGLTAERTIPAIIAAISSTFA